MRTVENPKKLFRKIDATDIDEDEYEFNIGEVEDSPPSSLGDVIDKQSVDMRKVTVEFEDLSDPADDFHASLAEIEEAATEVDDSSEVPDSVDTKFHTHEDGRTVTYLADSTRMGYEIINQESGPRLAGYAVIFPDKLVKIVT